MLEHGQQVEVLAWVVDELQARRALGLERLAAGHVEIVEDEPRLQFHQAGQVAGRHRLRAERAGGGGAGPVGPVRHEHLRHDHWRGLRCAGGGVLAELVDRCQELVEVGAGGILGADLRSEAHHFGLDGGGGVLEGEREDDGVTTCRFHEALGEALELGVHHDVGVGRSHQVGRLGVVVRRVQHRRGCDDGDVACAGELGQCAGPRGGRDHLHVDGLPGRRRGLGCAGVGSGGLVVTARGERECRGSNERHDLGNA